MIFYMKAEGQIWRWDGDAWQLIGAGSACAVALSLSA